MILKTRVQEELLVFVRYFRPSSKFISSTYKSIRETMVKSW